MDGESILYIIIAVVYFAVSALNSRKKAKEKKLKEQAKKQGRSPAGSRDVNPARPTRPVPTASEEETTLKDIIEEVFGNNPLPQQEPPVMIPVVDPEVEQINIRKAQELKRQQDLRNAQRQMAINKMNQRQKNIETARVARKAAHKRKHAKLYKSVGIRDAIVASIILDRPYK